MQCTPGPWHSGHLGEDGKCQCRTVVSEVYLGGIATVHIHNGIDSIAEGGNDAPPRDEAIANMHLIAAAPELYAALERMLGPAGYAGDNSIIQQAKAALAKARGETQ